MKTPDEIKKGLECCRQVNCPGDICPYYCEEYCRTNMSGDAFVLIQQLENTVQWQQKNNGLLEDAIETITPLISKWINIKDRLPEDGQMVAFIPNCNCGSVYVGRLSCIGKSGGVMFTHREGRFKSNYYAKWWMPMPEPPKEEYER